jgi:hypothetical protein
MITSHTDHPYRAAWDTNRRRTVVRRHHGRSKAKIFLRRCAGGLVIITLTIGVSSTWWVGKKIQTALDEIGGNKELHAISVAKHEELLAARTLLLSRDYIARVAKDLGLFPPSTKQMRTP